MGFAVTTIVCGVVIERNGKYLLVQERRPDVYGKWNLPAGYVDEGETLEEAAIREAKEETGFDIKLGRQLLVMHPIADLPVLHAYSCGIVGGSLSFPEDELLAAQWFSYEEVLQMKDELRRADYIIPAIAATRGAQW